MELRYAKEGDDIAGLWREVFPGDEGKTYFSREFTTAEVLVYEDLGQIMSMLHWTMQTMRMWGEDIPCAYVMGIGTRPEHRGKGLAGDLIEQALFELHLRKIPLACLIPAKPVLAGFYAKYGFFQAGARMKPPARVKCYPRADSADITELNLLYESMVDGLAHLTRPRKRWEAILDEYDVEFGGDAGYAVYDRGVWLEGTGGLLSKDNSNASCVKVVEAKMIAGLAAKHGKPLPGGIFDRYCPWNGVDDSRDSAEAEMCWFSGDPPYINLLYNGKDDETW